MRRERVNPGVPELADGRPHRSPPATQSPVMVKFLLGSNEVRTHTAQGRPGYHEPTASEETREAQTPPLTLASAQVLPWTGRAETPVMPVPSATLLSPSVCTQGPGTSTGDSPSHFLSEKVKQQPKPVRAKTTKVNSRLNTSGGRVCHLQPPITSLQAFFQNSRRDFTAGCPRASEADTPTATCARRQGDEH